MKFLYIFLIVYSVDFRMVGSNEMAVSGVVSAGFGDFRLVDVNRMVEIAMRKYAARKYYSFRLVEIYQKEIYRLCKEHDYNPALLIAQIDQESDFNFYAVSDAGAHGCMQIMPCWDHLYYRIPGLPKYIKKYGIERYRYRVPYNLYVGIQIMKYLIRKNDGSIDMALLEYSHRRATYNRYKHKKIPAIHNSYVAGIFSRYNIIIRSYHVSTLGII